MSMMDYERSWVLGLSGDAAGGPPWVRISASHVFGVSLRLEPFVKVVIAFLWPLYGPFT